MLDRWRFFLSRLSERLWVKPLLVCLLSVAGALLAHLADDSGLDKIVPDIKSDSLETLLKIISSSMLVIATFAVGSMVSAYASASSTATPRSFSLVIADDTSQNALSTFIGAFIFSIVALIALQNGYWRWVGARSPGRSARRSPTSRRSSRPTAARSTESLARAERRRCIWPSPRRISAGAMKCC
jgi:hypothetical protein